MSPSAKRLLESILALPEAERAEIAEAILCSLDAADDEAFFAELRRRSQEMDDDPSASIPWSEVRDQL